MDKPKLVIVTGHPPSYYDPISQSAELILTRNGKIGRESWENISALVLSHPVPCHRIEKWIDDYLGEFEKLSKTGSFGGTNKEPVVPDFKIPMIIHSLYPNCFADYQSNGQISVVGYERKNCRSLKKKIEEVLN